MTENSDNPQHILLVDDDVIVRSTIEEFLNYLGFRVITTGNGQEACDIMDRMHEQINLLITDICMPVLDGISLIRHVRRSNGDLPIVAITGYTDALDTIDDLHVVRFNKPLDFAALQRHLSLVRF